MPPYWPFPQLQCSMPSRPSHDEGWAPLSSSPRGSPKPATPVVPSRKSLTALAHEAGCSIEGPNCLGCVNYVDRVALTFVETPALTLGSEPGVSIVSQSGAMAAVLGVMLTSRELGLSYSVSTGNEAVSGVEDFVEYLLDDPMTKVVT